MTDLAERNQRHSTSHTCNGDTEAESFSQTDRYLPRTSTASESTRRILLLLFATLSAAFLLHLAVLSPAKFGAQYDDSIYVVAAKSLASGQGYRIISLPEPVAQTLIPPLYPFLLSLIWRADTRFPDNVTWMMLFSVFAAIGFFALTWRYLVKQGYSTLAQATAVVALAAINWRTMSLTTAIVSEVPYALLTVAALNLAEKLEKRRGWFTAEALGLGILIGMVFLTRSSGLVLLVVIAGYLALRGRWRSAVLPLSVSLIFVVGWVGWCYLNKSVDGGEHASYYAGYARGISETLDRLQTLNGTSRLMVHLNIIQTNAIGLLLVWAPVQSLGLRADMPAVFLIPLVLITVVLLVAGFVRELRKGLRLLNIYIPSYLLLHIAVPSHSYERYIMPIVPFLLFYLTSELSALIAASKAGLASQRPLLRASAILVGIGLTGYLSIALFSNATGIYRLVFAQKGSVHREEAQAMEWIKANSDPSDVLVCFADHKYHLYTGRNSVRSIPVNILDLVFYQSREPAEEELAVVFLNIVTETRSKYLVFSPTDFENQAPAYGRSIESLLEGNPNQFVPVFESENGTVRIYLLELAGSNRDRYTLSRS